MKDAIELRHKEGTGERCAVCHDSGELVPCGSCHALFHADCRAELGGCSTLGCLERVAIDRSLVEAREPPSWVWAIISSWLMAMALLGVLEGIGHVFPQGHYPSAILACRGVAFAIQVFVLPLVLASAWGRTGRTLVGLLAFQAVAVPLIALGLHDLDVRAAFFAPIVVTTFVLEPALAAFFASWRSPEKGDA